MFQRSIGWIIAPTYRLAGQLLREIMNTFPRELVVNFDKEQLSIDTINGGLIEFRSADDPDSLVSVGLDIVWITEAARIKQFDIVVGNITDRLDSPGRGPNGTGGLLLINSSPRGRTYFNEVCRWGVEGGQKQRPNWETFYVSRWDNPYFANLRNKVYDENIDLYEEYIYTNPFLMTVSKGGVVGYYMNSRNDQVGLEYDYINNASLVQFICNFIYVKRDALKGEDSYKLRFVISATDEDINSPLVNIDGSDTGRIRVLLTIKDKNGKEIGYTYADLIQYDIDSRRYTFEAELMTDDYINVYEKIRINNLQEMNTGKDIVTMINMMDLDISIYTFFKYDDMAILHKFSYMEELKEYTLTNSYTTYEDKIMLVEPLNVLHSTMKYTRLNESKYFTLIKDIPLIKMEDVRNDDGTKFMYLVDQLTKQYHHMTEILYEKTNNYSVDMKFFNTYGRSRNFTVDGTEELLNSVNCDIHFKVSLFNSYSAAETIEAMKIFIKDYFEEVNDNGMNGIYISNLIQSLENEFDEIKYIKFISINGYNTFVQCVENSKVDIESLDKEERIAFIPEFLNIDIDNISIDLE